MTQLYLIHGWATNGFIFNDLRRRLPENWRMAAPHLPGHGDAPQQGAFDVAAAADALAAQIDAAQPAFLLGWSLGGLVALSAAVRHPDKVKGLVLCATFAKLYAADDYPEGVKTALLARMLHLFEHDFATHMAQFLNLQLLHHPQRQAMIDAVLPDMVKHGTPAALAEALAAVEQTDLRADLLLVRCPVLLIYGTHDSVTPPRMGTYLQQHLPDAQLVLINKAAHAPFLSHAEEFAQQVSDFVAQHAPD